MMVWNWCGKRTEISVTMRMKRDIISVTRLHMGFQTDEHKIYIVRVLKTERNTSNLKNNERILKLNGLISRKDNRNNKLLFLHMEV